MKKQTKIQLITGWYVGLLQHLCLAKGVWCPVSGGQSQQNHLEGAADAAGAVLTKKSYKVLEVTVISMLSVRRDALLSELLSHSHQVSGVWVAKTAWPTP